MPNKKAKQKKWDKAKRQKENKQRKRDQKIRQKVVRQRAEYAEEFIKEKELWAEYMNFLPPEVNLK
jgi:hypothetical protein